MHKLPTSLFDFNEEAQNRRIKYYKVQMLPVFTVDKMVPANALQRLFIMLESYSILMITMKVLIESKIKD